MNTFTNIVNKKPKKDTSSCIPSGVICGNGDLSFIIDDDDDDLMIMLSKCDFWKIADGDENDGGIKSVCGIRIGNIDLSRYYVRQDILNGIVNCKFGSTEMELFVAVDNKIYIEIKSPQNKKYPSLSVEMSDSCNAKTFTCSDSGFSWYMRKFDGKNVKLDSAAAVCVKRFESENRDSIKSVKFCIGVSTSFETTGFAAKAIGLALNGDYAADKKKTAEHWNSFFASSSINIPDKNIEKQYYGSLYLLACCMGNKQFPPGLYGNFVTNDNVPWHGDYHLNYNYEAPFYAVFSSNHPELSKCYMQPLMDFMPEAKRFSAEFLGCNGVYYPVGIGPKGMDASARSYSLENGRLFLGQKSNASYAAVVPVMMWYSTYDKSYAEKYLYPYLKEVAEFWKSYLKKENGRYTVTDDAVHEVAYYKKNFDPEKHGKEIHAVNNLLSLGLIRMVLKCVIDMENTMGIDKQCITEWQEILDNLSEYPTFIKKGRRCFRYTEKGISWVKSNSLCIQHIYPASQIGSGSEKKLLRTALNTYFVNDRRLDDNGSCSYLPCGARLGVDSEWLLDGLRMNIKRFGLPNMLFKHHGGCLEHLSTVPATVNEMLLQSFEGIIRLFPCWNRTDNASFRDLRADGAFLVSSSIKKGKIGYIKIKSLAGRVCRVEVPENVKTDLRDASGKKIKYKKKDCYIEFRTTANTVYSVI